MKTSEAELLREKLQKIHQIQARETTLLGQLDDIMNGLDKCFEERVFLVEEFGPEAGTRDPDPAVGSGPTAE